MTRPKITDADLAREFRLLRCIGPPSVALTNPGIRRCLTTCAEIRQRREQHQDTAPDLKRRAAGDNDE